MTVSMFYLLLHEIQMALILKTHWQSGKHPKYDINSYTEIRFTFSYCTKILDYPVSYLRYPKNIYRIIISDKLLGHIIKSPCQIFDVNGTELSMKEAWKVQDSIYTSQTDEKMNLETKSGIIHLLECIVLSKRYWTFFHLYNTRSQKNRE